MNGALPNQDLINTVRHIAMYTGQCPVQLHSIPAELPSPTDLGGLGIAKDLLKKPTARSYIRDARNLLEDLRYSSIGNFSGSHGLFAEYRIDALTLFAEPADGPHGFHAFGIILESTCRSINNLLERLHASFHFYLFSRPGWFIKIGNYLPSTILLGASVTIGGLGMWIDAGWEKRVLKRVGVGRNSEKVVVVVKWTRRSRELGRAIKFFVAVMAMAWAGMQSDRLLLRSGEWEVLGVNVVSIGR